jgi:hypothetical protein
MASRKAFPLRLDPTVHEALQRWADAELRSVNAQIEFLLRRALQEAGRLPRKAEPAVETVADEEASANEN